VHVLTQTVIEFTELTGDQLAVEQVERGRRDHQFGYVTGRGYLRLGHGRLPS
jgi:hypothetical protein